jgi:hypothetical protein
MAVKPRQRPIGATWKNRAMQHWTLHRAACDRDVLALTERARTGAQHSADLGANGEREFERRR